MVDSPDRLVIEAEKDFNDSNSDTMNDSEKNVESKMIIEINEIFKMYG